MPERHPMTKDAQGIPGGGMRGRGGPGTGAGMVGGTLGPLDTAGEDRAQAVLESVREQNRNRPGGLGPEYAFDHDPEEQ